MDNNSQKKELFLNKADRDYVSTVGDYETQKQSNADDLVKAVELSKSKEGILDSSWRKLTCFI